MDEDVVKLWPIGKLQGWITYFLLDSDLQREAMEEGTRKQRREQRQAQSPKPGYGPFQEISVFDLPDPT